MNSIAPQITARPIAGALGAEVTGVGPLAKASNETIARIRELWLEHLVIFLRDQPLEPKDFVTFARRFGDVVHYPFLKGLEEAPDDRVPFGASSTCRYRVSRRTAAPAAGFATG